MSDKNDNVLLVTYHPLNNINGGTQMYKALIENFPSKSLSWIGTGAFLQKEPEFVIENTKYTRIIRSFIFSKNWIRVFSKFPFNILNIFFLYFVYTPRATLIILKTIKKKKINYVWIETFRQTYLIAFFLTRFTNVKIHLSFNDHYSAHSRWPETTFLKFILLRLLKSTSSFDFISKGMLEYFKENYNFTSTKYMILWVGNFLESNKKALIKKDVRKVIFYGSIHGLDVFYSFCQYISSTVNSEDEKVLDIYSEFDYSFISKRYKNVNYLGKVSQEDLAKVITNYDLVYVPIYFDSKNEIVSRTSLSSKMLLAINSGVPIFSHAPDYSANSILVNEFNLGYSCSSLGLDDIEDKMTFANNFEKRAEIQKSSIYFLQLNDKNSEKAMRLYELITA